MTLSSLNFLAEPAKQYAILVVILDFIGLYFLLTFTRRGARFKWLESVLAWITMCVLFAQAVEVVINHQDVNATHMGTVLLLVLFIVRSRGNVAAVSRRQGVDDAKQR